MTGKPPARKGLFNASAIYNLAMKWLNPTTIDDEISTPSAPAEAPFESDIRSLLKKRFIFIDGDPEMDPELAKRANKLRNGGIYTIDGECSEISSGIADGKVSTPSTPAEAPLQGDILPPPKFILLDEFEKSDPRPIRNLRKILHESDPYNFPPPLPENMDHCQPGDLHDGPVIDGDYSEEKPGVPQKKLGTPFKPS